MAEISHVVVQYSIIIQCTYSEVFILEIVEKGTSFQQVQSRDLLKKRGSLFHLK